MRPSSLVIFVAVLLLSASSFQPVSARGIEGVRPVDAWTCPICRPIKGNFTTYSGEPCIHVPSPAASGVYTA